MYPPAGSGESPFWDDTLPDPLAEELAAGVVNPRFLLSMLTDTTQQQDRRALTVLARAAATRPRVRTCLVGLLAVLPGLSPAAVDAALTGGHPAPLAEALVSLARNAALPAELLDIGQAGRAIAAAQRAVTVAATLAGKRDLPARAAASLRRTAEQARSDRA